MRIFVEYPVGIHPYTRLGHMEALEGARILERRLQLLSNDIANVDTVGFKRQGITFEEYLLSQIDRTKRTAKGELTKIDFSQGTLRETGNPFDFAIEGQGFFVVQGPDGPLYTRAGNFTLSAQNQLVTMEGYPVLGNGAPIVLEDTTGKGIWLSHDGRFFVDETDVGSIDVITFENPQGLMRIGRNLFQATNAAGAQNPAGSLVRQGYLEDSNVDPLTTMVKLIDLYRAYEAEQKTMLAVDQLDSRAVNDLGKLG